jgi:hypothetical protein
MPVSGSWYDFLRTTGTDVHVGEVPPAAGHWLSAVDDPEPTADEHRAFYAGVADHLDRFLAQEGVEGAAYVRGDFFCTRSEELQAYGERFGSRPAALAGAVRVVRAFLREHPRWRVVFPLGEGPEAAVAIYPGRIFFGPKELDEPSLDELMKLFVDFCVAQARVERPPRRHDPA